jgi:hypothetical protein
MGRPEAVAVGLSAAMNGRSTYALELLAIAIPRGEQPLAELRFPGSGVTDAE